MILAGRSILNERGDDTGTSRQMNRVCRLKGRPIITGEGEITGHTELCLFLVQGRPSSSHRIIYDCLIDSEDEACKLVLAILLIPFDSENGLPLNISATPKQERAFSLKHGLIDIDEILLNPITRTGVSIPISLLSITLRQLADGHVSSATEPKKETGRKQGKENVL